MVARDSGDHLLDEDGLADTGTTEEADLATLDVRGEQVDDLDAGLEHRRLRLELVEGGRRAVDAPALVDLEGLALLEVEAGAGRVEDLAEGDITDGDGDRAAGVLHLGAADEAVGRLQGDRTDHVVADVLGDLEVDRVRLGAGGDLGGQQVVLLGHGVDAELDVDDRAGDAGDAPDPTRGGGVLFGDGGSHGFSLPSHLDSARALAPPEISEISWVISA